MMKYLLFFFTITLCPLGLFSQLDLPKKIKSAHKREMYRVKYDSPGIYVMNWGLKEKVDLATNLLEIYPNWDEAVYWGSVYFSIYYGGWEKNKSFIHEHIKKYINCSNKIVTSDRPYILDISIARYYSNVMEHEKSYTLALSTMSKWVEANSAENGKIIIKNDFLYGTYLLSFYEEILLEYLVAYPTEYNRIINDNKWIFYNNDFEKLKNSLSKYTSLKYKNEGYIFLMEDNFITSSKRFSIPDEIRINNLTWMTNNLNVDTFRNGDMILQAKSDEEWKKYGEEKKAAWCYYDNDTNVGTRLGKLYNWYAVNDPRGLAPKGWRVPTSDEWYEMFNSLGHNGQDVKREFGWAKYGNGTNTSKFSGLPCGGRDYSGSFYNIGYAANWWSSTKWTFGNLDQARYYTITHLKDSVLKRNPGDAREGLSVRCVKE